MISRFVLTIWFLLGIGFAIIGQRVLILEEMTEVRPIKFYEGQILSVKLKSFPEDWVEFTIDRLMEDEKIILSDVGMIALYDISKIRLPRQWVRAVSTSLKLASSSVVVIGGMSLLSSNPISVPVIIGMSVLSYGLSRLLKKAWEYKIYRIGQRNRVRIIDLTLPSQSNVNKP